MLLNTADKVYAGNTLAAAVYLGDTKVWPQGVALPSGLAVHLDAADYTPGVWPNKGFIASNPTIVGSPVPVLRADALNGKPVVRFTINEGRLRGLCPGVTSEVTMIYVTRMVTNAVGRIFTVVYPPTNTLVGWHISGGDCCYDDGWVRSPDYAGGFPTPWRTYGFDMTLNPTRAQHFYIDGVLSGTQSSSGQGLGGTYNLSGYDVVGAQETCDCEVAELLIFNRCLTDVERQQVEGYLNTKYRLKMDPDTVAYITATGLGVGYHTALDNLVVGLKNAGLWSKMNAVYPFIGGTAALHRWNLKDPRDLDAAYRLTFTGGTHSTALGYRPNEQNQQRGGGQADTHLVPLGLMDQNSLHLAWYGLLDVPENDRAEMGCFGWSVAQSRMHIIARYQPSQCYYSMNEDGFANVDVAKSSGLFVSTRTDAAGQSLYINGASIASHAGASIGLPNVPVWVGGINFFANRTDIPCGFASIGSGLTAQNNADLYTVVQAYQTALGRQT